MKSAYRVTQQIIITETRIVEADSRLDAKREAFWFAVREHGGDTELERTKSIEHIRKTEMGVKSEVTT